jgi:hypothetical protein
MNTADRARHLAEAASRFPFLGPTSADDLLGLVAVELGDARALDQFVPRGAHRAQARPVSPLLHIVAGNTPAAALQTIVRGLLLGAHNFVKLPTVGLPEVDELRSALPNELSTQVDVSTELPDEWLACAGAVIVFGSDETIASLRTRVNPAQRFIPHGHRVSFGVVFDPDPASAAEAARDASAFDQLGCLSPHVFYVAGDARAYAARLAREMQLIQDRTPREPVTLSVANIIRGLREDTAFRAANGEGCAVWASEACTAWTVIFDTDPGFPSSPLHRTVFVKPLPADLAPELASVRDHLSCAGIFPATPDFAARLTSSGVSRICPLGCMQSPPWTWHQDGAPRSRPQGVGDAPVPALTAPRLPARPPLPPQLLSAHPRPAPGPHPPAAESNRAHPSAHTAHPPPGKNASGTQTAAPHKSNTAHPPRAGDKPHPCAPAASSARSPAQPSPPRALPHE